jgi:mitochondrial import inner membrane translocase subunit TIM10
MCSKKCISKFADAELAVGEMTCIDRCTGKYMHAHSIVGDVLQAFEAQLKAQQQTQQQLASKIA